MAISAHEAARLEKAGHKLTECKDCNGAGGYYPSGNPEHSGRETCDDCHGEGVLFSCPVPGCGSNVARYDLNPFKGDRVGGICDACRAEAMSLGMSNGDYLDWQRLLDAGKVA